MSVKQRVAQLEGRAPGDDQVKPPVVVVHGPGGPLRMTREGWNEYDKAHPDAQYVTVVEYKGKTLATQDTGGGR